MSEKNKTKDPRHAEDPMKSGSCDTIQPKQLDCITPSRSNQKQAVILILKMRPKSMFLST